MYRRRLRGRHRMHHGRFFRMGRREMHRLRNQTQNRRDRRTEQVAGRQAIFERFQLQAADNLFRQQIFLDDRVPAALEHSHERNENGVDMSLLSWKALFRCSRIKRSGKNKSQSDDSIRKSSQAFAALASEK